MSDWRDKAHKVVATLAHEAWLQANTRPDGKRYKRARSYRLPFEAEALVMCLNEDDEETAKAIFLRLAILDGSHTLRP